MIVSRFNLHEAIGEIFKARRISLDTETTGISPYKGAKVFSLIVHTPDEGYYFNFNNEPDHLGEFIDASYTFTYREAGDFFLKYLSRFERVYIHNAKFDLHHLAESFGVEYLGEILKSNIYCTEALARLVRNDLMSYSLANLGKLIGFDKDDSVEKYISTNKLYTLVDTGKKSPRKDKHYNKVPFEIIAPYGITDGKVCFELGEYVMSRLEQYSMEHKELGHKGNEELIKTELELTKVLFKMERIGVKIDRDYCDQAVKYYKSEIEKAKIDFLELTGIEFNDGRKVLVEAFEKLGLEYPLTEKGNPSFTDDVLSGINNPVANIIKSYRGAYKSAFTYYKNFQDLSDSDDVLHTNLRQGGTTTGRLSCREPNLQNVPKRSESGAYKARAAFIPRKGFFFLMIDYDQMEYRLFMDYAEEMDLIKKVLEGLDVHTATAEMIDVKRDIAKTINFLLLYGGGAGKLAGELGIELYKAKEYRSNYFQNLQNVKKITSAIISVAEHRGYIINTRGRRCYIPSKLAYKAANYLIQGGCGDIVKSAMVEIDKFLSGYKSRMILQIHDEILYEISYDEYHIINDLKSIMVGAYKYKHLPLTAGVEYSKESWHNKREFINGIT